MGKIPMIQIAKLREEKGLTQSQLARAMEADVSTVRNLERNRTGGKTIERIARLCTALDCSVQDLIKPE